MNELRDEIAKLTKKINTMKSGAETDKQALNILYDKRRQLYNQYHDHKMQKLGDKVLNIMLIQLPCILGEIQSNSTEHIIFS